MTTPACAVCGSPRIGDHIVFTAVDDDGVDRVVVCSIRCANRITNPGAEHLMPEPNRPRGLVDVPAEWLTKHIADVPAEWLTKHIANLSDEAIAEARADIAALRPRWLTHDGLGLFTPDTSEEECR